MHGSSCKRNGRKEKMRSAIYFECDISVEGKGEPYLVHRDACLYTFSWPTSIACPLEKAVSASSSGAGNKSGISGLRAFFLLLLVFLLSYIVFGTLFNYRVAGARGVETIPHFSRIQLCCDSVRSMWGRIVFSCKRRTAFVGGGSGGVQYRGLDDESMENLLSEEDDDEIIDDIGDSYYSQYVPSERRSYSYNLENETAGASTTEEVRIGNVVPSEHSEHEAKTNNSLLNVNSEDAV